MTEMENSRHKLCFSAQGAKILLLLGLISAANAQDCTEGTVELVGLLGVGSAGIVRVCVGEEWGTICADRDTPWSEKNCQVACRRAGFAGAINPILQSTLPASASAVVDQDPIHYRSVTCNGSETTLSSCPLSQITGACRHAFDAAITCKPYSSSSARAGDVRLLGNREEGAGAVEYYDVSLGGWTGVCVDSFYSRNWLANSAAASVVCRQLGYEEESQPVTEQGISTVALGRREAGALSCNTVSDFTLDSCSVAPADCNVDSTQLAGGVVCRKTGLEDYSLRLVGGTDRSGVVEVSFNGRWGTICEDSIEWSLEDAAVVCRQLGLPSPTQTISDQYPDYHSLYNKPSWLTGVECAGTEEGISDCSHSLPTGYTSCSQFVGSSAEVNCDGTSPTDGGLSGGAIAGIVIGSIVGVGVLAYLLHLWVESEKKKKAAAAEEAARRQRQNACAAAGEVAAAEERREIEARRQRDAAQRTPAPAQQPPAPADSTGEPAPHPDAELATAPPPSYQVAVSYPVASAPPTYSSEKSAPYPTQPLPYPPSSGLDAYPPPSAPSLADYPAPTVYNPAYS